MGTAANYIIVKWFLMSPKGAQEWLIADLRDQNWFFVVFIQSVSVPSSLPMEKLGIREGEMKYLSCVWCHVEGLKRFLGSFA